MMPATTMLRIAWICLTLLLASGCDVVHLDRPLGEPLPLKARYRLVGDWEFTADVDNATPSPDLQVRIRKDGQLRLAQLQWNQSEQKFLVLEYAAEVTHIGQLQFVNLDPRPKSAPPDPGTGPQYIPVQVHWLGKSKFELRPASLQKLTELIRQSEIEGTIEGGVPGAGTTVSVTTESLMEWLKKNPDQLERLFPRVEADDQRIIAQRVLEAREPSQQRPPARADQ